VALQTAQGVYFSVYNARVDRLTVLKTTFPETLYLTSLQQPLTPKVISVVAFRCTPPPPPPPTPPPPPPTTPGGGSMRRCHAGPGASDSAGC